MFLHSYRRVAMFIFLAMSLLFIDFASKAYIYYVFPFADIHSTFGYPIFNNFFGIDFSIGFAMNKGAAWGMFAQFQSILIFVRILMILAILVYLFFMNQNRRNQLPWVLIISGALGNMIDFFLYGSVVDFLQFNLWGYRFPLFNCADTFITLGVIGLILTSIFPAKKEELPSTIKNKL